MVFGVDDTLSCFGLLQKKRRIGKLRWPEQGVCIELGPSYAFSPPSFIPTLTPRLRIPPRIYQTGWLISKVDSEIEWALSGSFI